MMLLGYTHRFHARQRLEQHVFDLHQDTNRVQDSLRTDEGTASLDTADTLMARLEALA